MKKILPHGIVFLLLAGIVESRAQVTAFTYQGRLDDAGSGANGVYDFEFSLFDVAAGGVALDGPLTTNGVPVSNGLFTVTLDFGSDEFKGIPIWLEIGVRTNGGGGFTTLAPRTEITATPYAIYAATAPVAPNSIDSTHIINSQVGNADLANNSVTSAKILDGTITSADIANGGVARVDLNIDARYSLDAQDGTPTDAVFVNNEGRVGIGNLAPVFRLDVDGVTNQSVLRLAADSNPLMTFYEGATYRAFFQPFGNDLYLANRSAGRTLFRTANLDRMAIDAIGNVGIGTTVPDADARLHLLLPNSVSVPHFRIQSQLGDNGFGIRFVNPDETWFVGPNIGNWPDDRFNILADSSNRGLIVAANGNLGIGSVSAASPFTTLTVDGSIGFKSAAIPAIYVYESGTGNVPKPVIMHSPAFPEYGLYYEDTGDRFEMKSSAADATPSLVVDLDSNWVTIATDTPKPGYELSVNGQIVCEELLVEDSADWPDYVFEENYPLRALSEVENHIKEKKHLPGIPTAAEVKRDGLPIGEMQKRMMEKIEELTLYVIAQDKRLAAQEKQIRNLQSQLEEQ
jgi:hypothetical protein